MTGPSPRGTYLAIAEALRTRIAEGGETTELPSEADLMADFGVARTTVRRALKALKDDGLIESAPGVGWRPVAGGADRRPLAERFAELIRTSDMKVGATFPSESRLCGDFNASRTAVRRALAQLEGKGVLEAQPGRGRILRALPTADIES